MAQLREVVAPLLLIYAILLPAALAPELGSVALPPYRLALLVLLPLAIIHLLKRRHRPHLPDVLIALGSLWGFTAMLVTSSVAEGLEAGGSFALDGLGCYAVGRAYVSDVRKLRTVLVYLLPAVLVIAAIMAAEAISHRLIIAPLLEDHKPFTELRLGLMRSKAVFPHPIAAGLFMASLFSLYFLSMIRWRLRVLGMLAALSALFAGSSAAYAMLAMLFAMIAYRSFFTQLLKTRERLSYLFIAAASLLIFLELATERGAVRVIIELSLDPATGYYRLLIWEYGSLAVANAPLFGIGNAPMPRPAWMITESIDNHWLMLAVKYGLPTALLFVVGSIAAVWRCVVRNAPLNDFDRATTSGVVFAVVALTILGWTVAFWSNHFAWYMLLVGTVAALAEQLPRRSPARTMRLMAQPIVNRRPA
ncbi:MAG: O-antigen ligase family protein [Erythrobacter sp.]|jgi:O-antigen ligase|nr:O-antigen ligase family protein [Erythrobacter sp.]